jgi:hypothetical protein
MSNSTKIKGRKRSRKENLLAKLDHPVEMRPYGKAKGNRYTFADDEEQLVPEVNKKKERQKGKQIIHDGLDEYSEDQEYYAKGEYM